MNVFVFFMLFLSKSYSQNYDFYNRRNILGVGIGIAYTDIFRTHSVIPSINLNFEKNIRGFLSAGIDISSIYIAYEEKFQSAAFGNNNSEIKFLNLIKNDENNSLYSGRRSLRGVYTFSDGNNITNYNLPISLYISTNFKLCNRGLISLAIGPSIMYNSSNYSRDFSPVFYMRTDDGLIFSVNDEEYIALETEFRNIRLSSFNRISYNYLFKEKLGLGLQLSMFGIFLPKMNLFDTGSYWDISWVLRYSF